MKRSWQCPKCQSPRVGYLEEVADAARGEGATSRKLGYVRTGTEVFGLKVSQLGGHIEAFVCTDCGYLEEYVRDPRSVNWNQMRGFRWCRPEDASG